MFFYIFLNMFCKKFNMFGIFCNNKLVKTPICLLKFLSFFVKISELLVKNPEFFVKILRFFCKIFSIFGKRNKHDVSWKYSLGSCPEISLERWPLFYLPFRVGLEKRRHQKKFHAQNLSRPICEIVMQKCKFHLRSEFHP